MAGLIEEKEEKEPKFKKGDAVLGTLGGVPARGKVIGVKGEKIVIQLRGPAGTHATRRKVKGNIEQHEAVASDFELLYRKGA